MASEADDLFETFGDLFGQGRPRADLQQALRLTLAEADRGSVRVVEATRHHPCSACEGRGGPPGSEPIACGDCGGRGQTAHAHGFLKVTTNCPTCRGAGRTFETPCEACAGRGTEARPGRWDVTIPPGVAAGQKLRLKEQGHDLGQGPGDAYFTIAIEPHATLRRHGDDLHAKVSIDPGLAESGGALRVPWLDGEATVRVPAGASHGTRVTLRGWGTMRLGQPYAAPPEWSSPYRAGDPTARGDLVVTLQSHEEATPDPHELLGVTPGASRDELQVAYRRFAHAHHPDRHPDDPEMAERFEQVSAAYAQLLETAPAHAPVEASAPGAQVLMAIALAVVAIATAVLLLR
ncbi:MAG: DnaJ domain-containing protein [Sandaracinaceae bacterium]|nr:DnaJ domain-containing protein [Sandaracinaceae bacterium]